MKLIDILKELEEPNDDFLKRGFKLGKPTVDPETGAVSSEVTYLPEFERVRRDLLHMRGEFQPYKFSKDKDIADLAKSINTNLTKLSQMVFALDKMIELYRKEK